MIERGGHWGRHYMAPLAGPIHTDVWQRFELLVRRLSGLEEGPEGRRRVVPGMPVDNHAMGWQVPAMPGKKEERPRLMGSQRTGVPATGPVRCKG